MTSLRQRFIEDMQVRNFSLVTQASYTREVSGFARYFNKSPELLGPEQIRAYQIYLTNEKKLGVVSISVATSALRFLYRVTLKKNWCMADMIPSPKVPKKLPIILSQEEVVRFLDCVAMRKHRAILTTCYAAGLRISEAVVLTLPAIDSQRMVLRVEQGKGQKDRYVMLSPKLLEILRGWWRMERPGTGSFRGARRANTSRPRLRRCAGKPAAFPKFLNRSHRIPCVMLLHVTCLKRAPTFARFNSCSAIAAWRQPQNICTSRPAKCARHRARLICCPALPRWRFLLRSKTSNPRPSWIARSWEWRTSSAATAKPIVNSLARRCLLPSGAS